MVERFAMSSKSPIARRTSPAGVGLGPSGLAGPRWCVRFSCAIQFPAFAARRRNRSAASIVHLHPVCTRGHDLNIRARGGAHSAEPLGDAGLANKWRWAGSECRCPKCASRILHLTRSPCTRALSAARLHVAASARRRGSPRAQTLGVKEGRGEGRARSNAAYEGPLDAFSPVHQPDHTAERARAAEAHCLWSSREAVEAAWQAMCGSGSALATAMNALHVAHLAICMSACSAALFVAQVRKIHERLRRDSAT